jgi:hypothetical protein
VTLVTWLGTATVTGHPLSQPYVPLAYKISSIFSEGALELHSISWMANAEAMCESRLKHQGGRVIFTTHVQGATAASTCGYRQHAAVVLTACLS